MADAQGDQETIFCRTCGYCLAYLASNQCPECGAAFDLSDSATFDRWPKCDKIRWWQRRLAVVHYIFIAIELVFLVAFIFGVWILVPFAVLGLFVFAMVIAVMTTRLAALAFGRAYAIPYLVLILVLTPFYFLGPILVPFLVRSDVAEWLSIKYNKK
jgi:hypothetical protein